MRSMFIAFTMLLTQAGAAVAADVKVISASGMRPVLNELLPQFEPTTSHKLTVLYGSSVPLKRQIEAASGDRVRGYGRGSAQRRA
jgi:ABC-type molybdate transport system substrate-binding protein